jgi:hypothetical protein
MTTGGKQWTSELEEALRSELTVEAFAKGLLTDAPEERFQPFWLCSSSETRQVALSRIRELYEEWVELELAPAQARFDIEQEALGTDTQWTREIESGLRAELSVEAFVAGVLTDTPEQQCLPYWLCTNDEARTDALGRFRAIYEKWVQLELKAARIRLANEQETLRAPK